MNSSKLSPADANRLAVLDAQEHDGSLNPEETKELSRLRNLWRTAHVNWERQAQNAPATRIPGVEIPNRKDPYEG
jgi:hypothetical protein